ncbi:DUF427 domain-containing protein [Epibacterium sp. SM1979]|uniref:DUF427 domain-containing protein n=1 Tax=Tritonibacter litoralis TaxID=2662264 RepID=A0A843Y9L9_9RHOB|nr:DUF427 domain-containing protein [Tritonibacter litoralis]MQQ07616.1 DUF427 domain-containing protein [Tritonibacter litoralis]
MSDIRIRKIEGTWVVRSGGAVLGESTKVLELSEGDSAPVQFFPREDIAMAMLDESGKSVEEVGKGTATFFNIVNLSSTTENAAWSYEAPSDALSEIKDYLAFEKLESLKVEQV